MYTNTATVTLHRSCMCLINEQTLLYTIQEVSLHEALHLSPLSLFTFLEIGGFAPPVLEGALFELALSPIPYLSLISSRFFSLTSCFFTCSKINNIIIKVLTNISKNKKSTSFNLFHLLVSLSLLLPIIIFCVSLFPLFIYILAIVIKP